MSGCRVSSAQRQAHSECSMQAVRDRQKQHVVQIACLGCVQLCLLCAKILGT